VEVIRPRDVLGDVAAVLFFGGSMKREPAQNDIGLARKDHCEQGLHAVMLTWHPRFAFSACGGLCRVPNPSICLLFVLFPREGKDSRKNFYLFLIPGGCSPRYLHENTQPDTRLEDPSRLLKGLCCRAGRLTGAIALRSVAGAMALLRCLASIPRRWRLPTRGLATPRSIGRTPTGRHPE